MEEGHFIIISQNNQMCAGATHLRGSGCGCKGWRVMIEHPYISGVWLALKLSAVRIWIWQTKARGVCVGTCLVLRRHRVDLAILAYLALFCFAREARNLFCQPLETDD